MDKALEILKKYCTRKVIAGVSGGIDSMCLLSLLLDCGFINKDNIIVAHIDHNLRESSKRDKNLVEKFCAANGIKLKIFSPDINALAQKNKRSIETEARFFRHSVFKQLCGELNADLVLAHNANDQAETVLMHIFRGCGINGLKGMSERDGSIIRPLLSVSRSQIQDYVLQNNIPYFEDETNADLYYSRNLIRSMFSQIQEKYPQAISHINRLSDIAAQTEDYLSAQIDDSLISEESGAILLDKRALSGPLAAQYVFKAIKRAGLECDFEFKHIGAVIGLRDKPTGKKIDIIHGLIAAAERKNIAFYYSKPLFNGVSSFKQGQNILDGIVVLANECPSMPFKGQIIIDADKIKGAELRFRHDGDTFFACGGKRKKLKEYLNQKQIENRLKDRIPLICRGNEVLVVGNIELSEHVKVSENTKRALKIEIINGSN